MQWEQPQEQPQSHEAQSCWVGVQPAAARLATWSARACARWARFRARCRALYASWFGVGWSLDMTLLVERVLTVLITGTLAALMFLTLALIAQAVAS